MLALRRRVPLVALLLALAIPAVARANAYSAVEQAFSQSGTIQPCRFPSSELEAALKDAPTYDVEYGGALTDAINTALTEQGGGECNSRRSLAAAHETGGAGGKTVNPPGLITAGTGGSIPLPLLLGLIMVLGAGLLALAVATARVRGWDPEWAQAARHSWGEAEYRIAGTWEEFRDWLSGKP